MGKILSIILILCLLTGIAGCAFPQPSPMPPPSRPTQPSPSVTPTEPPVATYPLFSPHALTAQPEAISQQALEQIHNELNAILAQKSYDETGETLIWDTVALLSENYPNFSYLFGFLDPPDTATFLRQNILAPLAAMVDTLTCTHNGTGGGSAADFNKEICIDMTGSRESDCMTLIHELNHMVTSTHHNMHSSNIYHYLNEGDATLHQLTILGGLQYRNMGDVDSADRRHFAPGSDTLCMQVGGFGGGNYADFSLMFFKLLALTDFETMALFDQPAGEFLIRDALGDKYGEEGLAFYDSLTTKLHYDAVVANESLFLKLFLSRLSEVRSSEEMLSYLFLYRLYRKAFSPEYLQIDTDTIRELSHPELDYHAADKSVADALLSWDVLNREGLTEEDARLVALVISGRTQTAGSEDYWARKELEFYHPLNPFVFCGAWYTVEADISIKFKAELPDGGQIFYFETDFAPNLRAMAASGLLTP